jgi:cysteine desulfurase
MRIYFDHNATTPVDAAVAETIARVMTGEFGNASSVHHFGQRAKAILDEARSAVAALIAGRAIRDCFTSGGTESDNLPFGGVAEALEPTGKRHLIASSIEHEAVLVTLRALARRGWQTTLLPVDQTGIVDPETLRSAMTDGTAVVSVMHANNEIGTIQPVAELARIAHDRGALFHSDAVQSVGKIAVDVGALGVDFLSLSAHKFNGPKGVGALWIKRGSRVTSILTGGKHERNRASRHRERTRYRGPGRGGAVGAEEVDGRGGAAWCVAQSLEEAILATVPGTAINGSREPRVPNTTNISFRGGRSREPADCARSRRGRGVYGLGVLVGHARAIARPSSDGSPIAAHAEFHSPQSWRGQYRRGSRLRCVESCLPIVDKLRSLTRAKVRA